MYSVVYHIKNTYNQENPLTEKVQTFDWLYFNACLN